MRVQTAVFANTAYMGIPSFLTAIYPEGLLPATIGTQVANPLLIGDAVKEPILAQCDNKSPH
ncbi:MAG: hypothetical protein OXR03_19175 [Rhodospirillaceae bacterium]|nr:hypothetical protein [Rhodospirillaceae bacterium]MDD9927952.1 hypothetical protein [Rhodospirillaceae bacterium]